MAVPTAVDPNDAHPAGLQRWPRASSNEARSSLPPAVLQSLMGRF
jgi:hypothetical protein